MYELVNQKPDRIFFPHMKLSQDLSHIQGLL